MGALHFGLTMIILKHNVYNKMYTALQPLFTYLNNTVVCSFAFQKQGDINLKTDEKRWILARKWSYSVVLFSSFAHFSIDKIVKVTRKINIDIPATMSSGCALLRFNYLSSLSQRFSYFPITRRKKKRYRPTFAFTSSLL